MAQLPFLLLAGLILCSFFFVSFSSQKLRLPSVLIYIVLGIALTSFFRENEAIHLAGEVGIVLLFFILGLEFPLTRMVEISRRIWPAGLMDVLLNTGGAMALALLFGLNPLAAFVLGSVAYATSSSISAKLLEEQKRLANPETEFILALLIFEDLISPVLVSFIAAARTGEEMTIGFVGLLLLKIILLMTGVHSDRVLCLQAHGRLPGPLHAAGFHAPVRNRHRPGLRRGRHDPGAFRNPGGLSGRNDAFRNR